MQSASLCTCRLQQTAVLCKTQTSRRGRTFHFSVVCCKRQAPRLTQIGTLHQTQNHAPTRIGTLHQTPKSALARIGSLHQTQGGSPPAHSPAHPNYASRALQTRSLDESMRGARNMDEPMREPRNLDERSIAERTTGRPFRARLLAHPPLAHPHLRIQPLSTHFYVLGGLSARKSGCSLFADT